MLSLGNAHEFQTIHTGHQNIGQYNIHGMLRQNACCFLGGSSEMNAAGWQSLANGAPNPLPNHTFIVSYQNIHVSPPSVAEAHLQWLSFRPQVR